LTTSHSRRAAQRTYDAEGRMTSEQNSVTTVFNYYTYDAGGRRARRNVGGNVTWQVYVT
jgi:YD repeat-containing protein